MRSNDKHNWKCEIDLWLFADTKFVNVEHWKNLAGIRASKRGYQVAQFKVKNKKIEKFIANKNELREPDVVV